MKITQDEKEFIKGYANALQDIMLKITGYNNVSKSYDPCDFKDDEILHSYSFDLKYGGRRHNLSDFKDIDEIKYLMLKECENEIKTYIQNSNDNN